MRLFGLDCEEVVRFVGVLLEQGEAFGRDEVAFVFGELLVERYFLVNVDE